VNRLLVVAIQLNLYGHALFRDEDAHANAESGA
jgi:hypothetical protein